MSSRPDSSSSGIGGSPEQVPLELPPPPSHFSVSMPRSRSSPKLRLEEVPPQVISVTSSSVGERNRGSIFEDQGMDMEPPNQISPLFLKSKSGGTPQYANEKRSSGIGLDQSGGGVNVYKPTLVPDSPPNMSTPLQGNMNNHKNLNNENETKYTPEPVGQTVQKISATPQLPSLSHSILGKVLRQTDSHQHEDLVQPGDATKKTLQNMSRSDSAGSVDRKNTSLQSVQNVFKIFDFDSILEDGDSKANKSQQGSQQAKDASKLSLYSTPVQHPLKSLEVTDNDYDPNNAHNPTPFKHLLAYSPSAFSALSFSDMIASPMFQQRRSPSMAAELEEGALTLLQESTAISRSMELDVYGRIQCEQSSTASYFYDTFDQSINVSNLNGALMKDPVTPINSTRVPFLFTQSHNPSSHPTNNTMTAQHEIVSAYSLLKPSPPPPNQFYLVHHERFSFPAIPEGVIFPRSRTFHGTLGSFDPRAYIACFSQGLLTSSKYIDSVIRAAQQCHHECTAEAGAAVRQQSLTLSLISTVFMTYARQVQTQSTYAQQVNMPDVTSNIQYAPDSPSGFSGHSDDWSDNHGGDISGNLRDSIPRLFGHRSSSGASLRQEQEGKSQTLPDTFEEMKLYDMTSVTSMPVAPSVPMTPPLAPLPVIVPAKSPFVHAYPTLTTNDIITTTVSSTPSFLRNTPWEQILPDCREEHAVSILPTYTWLEQPKSLTSPSAHYNTNISGGIFSLLQITSRTLYTINNTFNTTRLQFPPAVKYVKGKKRMLGLGQFFVPPIYKFLLVQLPILVKQQLTRRSSHPVVQFVSKQAGVLSKQMDKGQQMLHRLTMRVASINLYRVIAKAQSLILAYTPHPKSTILLWSLALAAPAYFLCAYTIRKNNQIQRIADQHSRLNTLLHLWYIFDFTSKQAELHNHQSTQSITSNDRTSPHHNQVQPFGNSSMPYSLLCSFQSYLDVPVLLPIVPAMESPTASWTTADQAQTNSQLLVPFSYSQYSTVSGKAPLSPILQQLSHTNMYIPRDNAMELGHVIVYSPAIPKLASQIFNPPEMLLQYLTSVKSSVLKLNSSIPCMNPPEPFTAPFVLPHYTHLFNHNSQLNAQFPVSPISYGTDDKIHYSSLFLQTMQQVQGATPRAWSSQSQFNNTITSLTIPTSAIHTSSPQTFPSPFAIISRLRLALYHPLAKQKHGLQIQCPVFSLTLRSLIQTILAPYIPLLTQLTSQAVSMETYLQSCINSSTPYDFQSSIIASNPCELFPTQSNVAMLSNTQLQRYTDPIVTCVVLGCIRALINIVGVSNDNFYTPACLQLIHTTVRTQIVHQTLVNPYTLDSRKSEEAVEVNSTCAKITNTDYNNYVSVHSHRAPMVHQTPQTPLLSTNKLYSNTRMVSPATTAMAAISRQPPSVTTSFWYKFSPSTRLLKRILDVWYCSLSQYCTLDEWFNRVFSSKLPKQFSLALSSWLSSWISYNTAFLRLLTPNTTAIKACNYLTSSNVNVMSQLRAFTDGNTSQWLLDVLTPYIYPALLGKTAVIAGVVATPKYHRYGVPNGNKGELLCNYHDSRCVCNPVVIDGLGPPESIWKQLNREDHIPTQQSNLLNSLKYIFISTSRIQAAQHQEYTPTLVPGISVGRRPKTPVGKKGGPVILSISDGGHVCHFITSSIRTLTALSSTAQCPIVHLLPALAPAQPYPAQQLDTINMYYYLAQGGLGFVPSKIIILGGSTGGSLAVSLQTWLSCTNALATVRAMVCKTAFGVSECVMSSLTSFLLKSNKQSDTNITQTGEGPCLDTDQRILQTSQQVPNNNIYLSDIGLTPPPIIPVLSPMPSSMTLLHPPQEPWTSLSSSKMLHITDPLVPLSLLQSCQEAYSSREHSANASMNVSAGVSTSGLNNKMQYINKRDVNIEYQPMSILAEALPPITAWENIFVVPLNTPDSILKGFPNTNVLCGSYDPFLDDSVSWTNRLYENGVTTKLAIVDMLPHGFTHFSMALESAKTAQAIITKWLTEFVQQDSFDTEQVIL